MKHIGKIAAATAVACAAGMAQAQGMYGELGYSHLKFEESGTAFSGKVNPTMARGIIGYELNPNLAVEGMVGLGMSSDDIRVGSATLKGKVDNMVGAFVKPKVKLGETVELFGRAGVVSTKVSAEAGRVSVSDRGTSFAYGGGASFALTPTLSLNADYMRYYDRKGIEVDGVTVGVGFKF
jgi:attachment invasion locus protein